MIAISPAPVNCAQAACIIDLRLASAERRPICRTVTKMRLRIDKTHNGEVIRKFCSYVTLSFSPMNRLQRRSCDQETRDRAGESASRLSSGVTCHSHIA
ncbi:hypothetical protein PILCRDRAFT_258158 [Piloderma croceum F 1598]|uniref:Uncharacterized protein n=1 Tax=Piloderma croceum (strain F 1598) TaxID=765440 RepID=A0A0C3BPQ3_PILCF|nr:hypothetical protein PILCRDRAFT_258158 [Piloderma croceum F 1598]